MTTVKIIADSTCDIGPTLAKEYDIDIVPLYVTLGSESCRDGIDITGPGLLERCARTQEAPKTAASSVGDFISAFRPYAQAGRDIVFIGISAKMSVQVQNAQLAAQEFPGRIIRCIDSENLSTGIGLLVLKAAEHAAAGMDADSIAREIEALRPKVRASFVLDTLSFLRRGGRCSGLQALGAAILNIKPQITVSEGTMAPTEKYRGRIERVIPRYLQQQLQQIERIDPARVFVTYTTFDRETLAPFLAQVEATGHFEQIHHTIAGSVISSHCGPRTLGILYLEK